MNRNQRIHAIMSLVASRYADSEMKDSEFAKMAGEELGFPVARASITQARKDLNILNNQPRSMADVEELKALLSEIYTVTVLEKELAARVRAALRV